VTKYWVRTLIGLAIAGAAVVGFDWGIYHLVRTGSCGSSPTYISVRPCPPGTGGHILALIGGVFAGLIGIAVYASRGKRGRPSPIALGLIMWSLLFLTLAGSVALAAYGPANNDNSGARTAAIVLGFIFVPMGLAPLPLALGGGRKRQRLAQLAEQGKGFTAAPAFGAWPAPAAAPFAAAAGTPAPAPDDDDPLDKIAKLGQLRDRGIVTPEEFEAQKRRLLDEL
jgi:Short C-terminal domain